MKYWKKKYNISVGRIRGEKLGKILQE